MKAIKTVIFVAILFATQTISAQQTTSINWDNWKFLMGEWVGEGNGQPGQGSGSFTFQTDLDGKIMVRKNHTEFPATKDKPAFVHDDLLVVYPDYTGTASKAIYFDNEGHVINYTITYTDNSIVFTSEAIPNAPRFRLSYINLGENTVNIKFEFASPQNQDDFKTYLEGKSKKVKYIL